MGLRKRNMLTANFSINDSLQFNVTSGAIEKDNSELLTNVLYGIYFLQCIVGLCGNIYTIHVCSKQMRFIPSILVLNMSLANVFSFINIPFTVIPRMIGYWPFPILFCKLSFGLSFLWFFASYTFLAIMNMDVALLYTSFTKYRTDLRAVMKCITVWTICICCTLPYIVNSTLYQLPHGKVCIVGFHSKQSEMTVNVANFVLFYVLPLMLIIFSNIVVYKRGKPDTRLMSRACLMRAKETHKMYVISSLIYFSCWTMFWVAELHVLDNIPLMGNPMKSELLITNISRLLMYLAQIIFPLVHFMFNTKI